MATALPLYECWMKEDWSGKEVQGTDLWMTSCKKPKMPSLIGQRIIEWCFWRLEISGITGRKADPGKAGSWTSHVAREAVRKSLISRGSPLGRHAVRPPITPDLKSEIRPLVRTTTRGSGCAP